MPPIELNGKEWVKEVKISIQEAQEGFTHPKASPTANSDERLAERPILAENYGRKPGKSLGTRSIGDELRPLDQSKDWPKATGGIEISGDSQIPDHEFEGNKSVNYFRLSKRQILCNLCEGTVCAFDPALRAPLGALLSKVEALNRHLVFHRSTASSVSKGQRLPPRLSTGQIGCSNCRKTFELARDFCEHLRDCVLWGSDTLPARHGQIRPCGLESVADRSLRQSPTSWELPTPRSMSGDASVYSLTSQPMPLPTLSQTSTSSRSYEDTPTTLSRPSKMQDSRAATTSSLIIDHQASDIRLRGSADDAPSFGHGIMSPPISSPRNRITATQATTTASTQGLVFRCPFPELGCQMTFNSSLAWLNHSVVHFGGSPPPTHVPCGSHCNRVFDSWYHRMKHVEFLITQGPWPTNDSTNIELYRCLWDNGIIDSTTFREIQIDPSNLRPSSNQLSGQLSQTDIAHGPVVNITDFRRRRRRSEA